MKYTSYSITLRQMQYVCAVAETLNFRRAAELCYVAQPSLSAQIAEAENILGLTLFERDRRSVRISKPGEAVIPKMREILNATGDLIDATRVHHDPFVGTMRMGVIPTIGPYLLPDLHPALHEAFPDLKLQWVEEKTDVLVQKIENGELDAAVVALEADLGQCEHLELCWDPFVVAIPPGHPLGRKRSAMKVAELAEQNVMLLDDGHCFRDQALDLCRRVGARQREFRATSLSTLVQMVHGNDVTLLPAMAVEVENRRSTLKIRPLESPSPGRQIVLAFRKKSPLRPALEAIAQVARPKMKA